MDKADKATSLALYIISMEQRLFLVVSIPNHKLMLHEINPLTATTAPCVVRQ